MERVGQRRWRNLCWRQRCKGWTQSNRDVYIHCKNFESAVYKTPRQNRHVAVRTRECMHKETSTHTWRPVFHIWTSLSRRVWMSLASCFIDSRVRGGESDQRGARGETQADTATADTGTCRDISKDPRVLRHARTRSSDIYTLTRASIHIVKTETFA